MKIGEGVQRFLSVNVSKFVKTAARWNLVLGTMKFFNWPRHFYSASV